MNITNKINVELLHHTPLELANKAIRICYDSQDKSDGGSKDKALINRVGNKFKHKSTLRHVTYNFHCTDVSSKTLLALTRHSIGKDISVQSTRFTTKKRRDKLTFTSLPKPERNEKLTRIIAIVDEAIEEGWSNDEISMLLPMAYNYSFIMTMNIQSLQHFLNLRLGTESHYNIRELAKELYLAIPEDHKFLFEEQKSLMDG